MLWRGLLALAATLGLQAGPALAQDQTLADIRQELSVLYLEVQRLKTELSTTAAPGVNVAGSTPLERLDAIEAELQRLTSKTEELEFRVNRITVDGTNRIGDLEFRLCELEPDCDIATLDETPSLGGVDSAAEVPVPNPAPPTGGPALAVGEQADFSRAQEALAAGDFRGAADLLAAFGQTYPGSPLGAEAAFLRGQAHEGLGEMTNAARGFLESFQISAEGPFAAQALTRLGIALGRIGQVQDACITLSEVPLRFPASDEAAEADRARAEFGCS